MDKLPRLQKDEFELDAKWFGWLLTPCFACGSIAHGFVETVQINGKENWRYTCPVLKLDDWKTDCVTKQWCSPHQIDPSKFALEYGYNEDAINQAWNDYIKLGDGWNLKDEYQQQTRNEISRICDEIKSNWVYKRESQKPTDDNSEHDWEQDESGKVL